MVNKASKNTKPVAVWYGGTFDPPHQGHQRIVEALVRDDTIDTVIVTPAWLNPFKRSSLASPQQRLRWVQKIFDDPKVVIDRDEVEAGRPVFTAETIRRLRRHYDLHYIAIGSDNLRQITSWHDFDWLNDHVTWLVFARDGFDEGYEVLRDVRKISLDVPISSSQIRSEQDTRLVDEKIRHDVQKIFTKGKK